MKNKYSVGIILLLVGAAILLGKAGVFSFLASIFWPLLVLIPAVILHVLYFGRVLPAITLIPAGILLVYSLLFVFFNIFGWNKLNYLWPLFIFGVAVGLYEYQLFGSPKQRYIKKIAIVIGILSILALLSMMLWNWGIYILAIICLVVGAYLIWGPKNAGRRFLN